MSFEMTTAWLSATTVRSVNTPALANWKAFSPPTVKGRLSLPIVSRQWVGWPRSHASHSPQLPSVVSTTWSPTCTLRTASPTSSTTPAPSCPSTTGVGNGMVPSSTDTSEWHRPGVDDPHHHLVRPRPAHLDVVADLQLASPDKAAH